MNYSNYFNKRNIIKYNELIKHNEGYYIIVIDAMKKSF